MATGTLSTLGIGSNGALSYDIIDQLKEADTEAIIKPIENKIELNQLKQEKLDELTGLVSDLNTQVVTMSDPALYNAKETLLTGDSVSVTASASAKAGNHTLNVTSLATHDIKQSSTGYAYDGALMGEGSMTLEIGEGSDKQTFTIDVSSTDSIQDVVDKINEQTDGKIKASLINVGGSDPYHLVLKSAETGSSNNITVSGDYGFDQVGEGAKDAQFNFDGIDITRPGNNVDDLIEGLTFTLEKTGQTNITVKQDNSKLIEEMQNFVDSYNKMIQAFTDSTKFNQEDNSAGIFQGDASVRSAASTLKDALILSSQGDLSIADFGLEQQRDGTLIFNQSDFEEKLNEDPQVIEDFFRGTDGRNGAFNRLESAIFDIKTSSNGTLKTLGKNLDDDATRLLEQQEIAQKRLDDRYSIMASQFAAYDAMIAKLNQQGDMLTAMIDAEDANK